METGRGYGGVMSHYAAVSLTLSKCLIVTSLSLSFTGLDLREDPFSSVDLWPAGTSTDMQT